MSPELGRARGNHWSDKMKHLCFNSSFLSHSHHDQVGCDTAVACHVLWSREGVDVLCGSKDVSVPCPMMLGIVRHSTKAPVRKGIDSPPPHPAHVGEGSLSLAFAVVLYSGARYEEKGCLIM
jgi:hypothetical protein